VIEPGELQELIGRWWWNYDEGNFEVLASLLTDDMHFTCHTDSGTTDYEEFVRADQTGRDAVVTWQTDHRQHSPYPLRHYGTNVHIVEQQEDEATFASYILVTHVAGGVAPASSGIVRGRVRRVGDALCLAALHVALDTTDSKPFSER
jgi:SnoaL-like domain